LTGAVLSRCRVVAESCPSSSGPTNRTASESDPTFSPDGSKIAFASNRDGDYEIFVMDASGANPTQLTFNTAGDYRPDWQALPLVGDPCANPTKVGTAGADKLFGTPGPDVIVGLGGNDSIYGYAGDDVICGNEGYDVIYAGFGNDFADGGAGNDTVVGDAGNDDVRGGDGTDKVFGSAGNDQVNGGPATDNCYGGTGTNIFSACEVFPAGM